MCMYIKYIFFLVVAISAATAHQDSSEPQITFRRLLPAGELHLYLSSDLNIYCNFHTYCWPKCTQYSVKNHMHLFETLNKSSIL